MGFQVYRMERDRDQHIRAPPEAGLFIQAGIQETGQIRAQSPQPPVLVQQAKLLGHAPVSTDRAVADEGGRRFDAGRTQMRAHSTIEKPAAAEAVH